VKGCLSSHETIEIIGHGREISHVIKLQRLIHGSLMQKGSLILLSMVIVFGKLVCTAIGSPIKTPIKTNQKNK
jgi:hypothetical protein